MRDIIRLVKKYIWWEILAIVIAGALFLSSQNGEETVQTSLFVADVFVKILNFLGVGVQAENIHMSIRTMAHMAVFFLIGFLLTKAIHTTQVKHKFLVACLIGCAIGIVDEVHKTLIPGRNCDLSEILLNCACVVFMCLVMSICKTRKEDNE